LSRLILFNKPYGVLTQFTDSAGRPTLADYIPIPKVYAAGRLDADSEGLLLLTSDGVLQHRLTDPAFGHWRRYWVQVEGDAARQPQAMQQLRKGMLIQGQRTLPAQARLLEADAVATAGIGERNPPIRTRLHIPTSWIELELREGRNRQVRRMTAAVGLPTLRLIRVAIDLMDGEPPLTVQGLEAGCWRHVSDNESERLRRLQRRGRPSPGRGGRAGGGKSGQGEGGG
jgi:23S rRNA pseudouridine2457 synthase